MVTFAYISSVFSYSQKHMYITINSSLSSINFDLGLVLEVKKLHVYTSGYSCYN